MIADTCTYDFMQLNQAKNTVIGRQKRSMAVTLLLLDRDGATSTDFGRMRAGDATHTADALGQWDCPQPFQAVALLRPLTRKGWYTFLKWLMAVLHACFAVGCCFVAGRLIVVHFSLLIWSISSNPVGSGTLFYWSSDVAWDPLTVFTPLRCRDTLADFLKHIYWTKFKMCSVT